MQEPCPLSTCGVWKQDFKRSESLCPFMAGLFPWPLSSVACTVADYTPVTLRILCKSPTQIEIVDKTTFGRNVTEVRWPVLLFRFLVAKLSYLSLTGLFFPMTFWCVDHLRWPGSQNKYQGRQKKFHVEWICFEQRCDHQMSFVPTRGRLGNKTRTLCRPIRSKRTDRKKCIGEPQPRANYRYKSI